MEEFQYEFNVAEEEDRSIYRPLQDFVLHLEQIIEEIPSPQVPLPNPDQDVLYHGLKEV